MAVDESNVPRIHQSGAPEDAIVSLKKLRLPDVPSAEEIKAEPTLVAMDMR